VKNGAQLRPGTMGADPSRVSNLEISMNVMTAGDIMREITDMIVQNHQHNEMMEALKASEDANAELIAEQEAQ